MSLLFCVISLSGCLALTPQGDPHTTISWGTPSSGFLRNGVALPARGEGFVRARPTDSTHYGTRELTQALERAAASVIRTYPGTSALHAGDLSSPQGGAHARHGSHRAGRDMDIIFYLMDENGDSVPSRGWLAFDRFGVGHEGPVTHRENAGDVYFFDEARNWHFVRTLVLDEEAKVQWIFCSAGVKTRLLKYAIAHEKNADALFRATWILHQPTDGRPHNDHFHVRVLCDPDQLSLGCRNVGPIWPWLRKSLDKPFLNSAVLSDDAVVQALITDVETRRVDPPRYDD